MRSSRTDIFLFLLSFDSAVRSGFVDLDEGLDLDFYPGSDFDFDFDFDLDLGLGLEIVDLEKDANSTPMRAATNFAAAHLIRSADWLTRIVACRQIYARVAEHRRGPSLSLMVHTGQIP